MARTARRAVRPGSEYSLILSAGSDYMELGNQRESSNVEDRRGMGMVGGGLGLGGIAIAVVAYFLGFDPGTALQVAEQVTAPNQMQQGGKKGAPADEGGQFS